MKAFNIVLKGNPCKNGSRHCLIIKAKEVGINGYINYRQYGEELFLHAEGENDAIASYMSWLQNLVSESQLEMDNKPALYLGCEDFQIVCNPLLLSEISLIEYRKSIFIEAALSEDNLENESPVKILLPEWIRTPIRSVSHFIGRKKHAGPY
jgi:acylphosphatase